MAGQVLQDDIDPGQTCWCCGSVERSDRLVRLGDHPEVALCLGCARWAALRASEIEDRDRQGIGPRARHVVRRVREGVVRRGWHRSPLIGAPLRWLGRHLP